MAIIAFTKDDIEKFLEYETAAYNIAIEINHAMLVYSVGSDLGYVLCQSGVKELKDQGIAMLKRSLAIGKAAGFPDEGRVEKISLRSQLIGVWGIGIRKGKRKGKGAGQEKIKKPGDF
jgi:hypothetical protein